MRRLILAGALLLMTPVEGLAQSAEPSADSAYLAYAADDHTATLGSGGRIHVVCLGEAAPTVILTAGLGDWGATWRAVQGAVAEQARVCAWDRPGFGFSDASPEAQTSDATTSDLEEALAAADIHGPYVMVGHSLGGAETLLFTDRNPERVVGMVLVDSIFPDQASRLQEAAPVSTAIDARELSAAASALRQCASDLAAGAVSSVGPDPNGCLRTSPAYPSSVAAALIRLDSNPLRQATRASTFENVFRSSALLANPARDYGDMPLVVLTAGEEPDDIPDEMTDWDAQQAAWEAAHREFASMSSRGVNRVVQGAGHYIQIDRPDVVIAAILEVVDAVRSQESQSSP